MRTTNFFMTFSNLKPKFHYAENQYITILSRSKSSNQNSVCFSCVACWNQQILLPHNRGSSLLTPNHAVHLFQVMEHSLTNKQTPWSESASELYRPSDRRLSAKWLPTFADKGCHVVSVMDPYSRFSRQEPLLFYQVAPQLYSRGWT
jgi:hypothetical protein